ncbi:hypothetical protein Franean1_2809 [Parafrankia sp. EAN1pec]|nr:hypothetical protein Franean1_2809 [Frankia sp. EAN1pec]
MAFCYGVLIVGAFILPYRRPLSSQQLPGSRRDNRQPLRTPARRFFEASCEPPEVTPEAGIPPDAAVRQRSQAGLRYLGEGVPQPDGTAATLRNSPLRYAISPRPWVLTRHRA